MTIRVINDFDRKIIISIHGAKDSLVKSLPYLLFSSGVIKYMDEKTKAQIKKYAKICGIRYDDFVYKTKTGNLNFRDIDAEWDGTTISIVATVPLHHIQKIMDYIELPTKPQE